jgi:hypothetical protein
MKMIYSVWDNDNQRYKYFSVGEARNDDGPTPRKRGGSPIGYSPEEVSWTLPPNAKLIGAGVDAKGVVVHPSNGGSSLDGIGDIVSSPLVLVAIAAIGLYYLKDGI